MPKRRNVHRSRLLCIVTLAAATFVAGVSGEALAGDRLLDLINRMKSPASPAPTGAQAERDFDRLLNSCQQLGLIAENYSKEARELYAQYTSQSGKLTPEQREKTWNDYKKANAHYDLYRGMEFDCRFSEAGKPIPPRTQYADGPVYGVLGLCRYTPPHVGIGYCRPGRILSAEDNRCTTGTGSVGPCPPGTVLNAVDKLCSLAGGGVGPCPGQPPAQKPQYAEGSVAAPEAGICFYPANIGGIGPCRPGRVLRSIPHNLCKLEQGVGPCPPGTVLNPALQICSLPGGSVGPCGSAATTPATPANADRNLDDCELQARTADRYGEEIAQLESSDEKLADQLRAAPQEKKVEIFRQVVRLRDKTAEALRKALHYSRNAADCFKRRAAAAAPKAAAPTPAAPKVAAAPPAAPKPAAAPAKTPAPPKPAATAQAQPCSVPRPALKINGSPLVRPGRNEKNSVTTYSATTGQLRDSDGPWTRAIQWTFKGLTPELVPGTDIKITISGSVNVTDKGKPVGTQTPASAGVRARGLKQVTAQNAYSAQGEAKPGTFVFNLPCDATGATIEFGGDYGIGVFAIYYYGDHKPPAKSPF